MDAMKPKLLVASANPNLLSEWERQVGNQITNWDVAVVNTDAALQSATDAAALLLDGMLFPNPDTLLKALRQWSTTPLKVVVLLPDIPALLVTVQGIACVMEANSQALNLQVLLPKLYQAWTATHTPKTAASGWDSIGVGSVGSVGMKILAVWNLAGGTGKTTLATTLAWEARKRGLRTLLISLNPHDDSAMMLRGLKAENRPTGTQIVTPQNIHGWIAEPNAKGLKENLQNWQGLDVMVGFKDLLGCSEAARIPHSEPNSVANLINVAAYAGYAAIVLDIPSTAEIAGHAISAANALLLVARPTYADAVRTAGAYTTVTKLLAAKHHIPPEGIALALNLASADTLASDVFVDACRTMSGASDFPAATVRIPLEPKIATVQNERDLPSLTVNSLGQAIGKLADTLLPVRDNLNAAPPVDNGRTFKLGFLNLRTKGK